MFRFAISFSISFISGCKALQKTMSLSSVDRHILTLKSRGTGMLSPRSLKIFSLQIQRRWLGPLPETKWKEAAEHVKIYKQWFHESFFANGQSQPLFVLSIEFMHSRYRDEDFKYVSCHLFSLIGHVNTTSSFVKYFPRGVNDLILAPMVQAPELVVPSKL